MSTNLTSAWGVVRALLSKFRYGEIKEIAGLAGLDVTSLTNLQRSFGGNWIAHRIGEIDERFEQQNETEQKRFLTLVIEEALRRDPTLEESFQSNLERLGLSFAGGHLLPNELFDVSELPEIPVESHQDILKAAARLRDGDLSGAVSAACGSVDAITSKIYEEKKLGDAGEASFQEKVVKSLEATGVLSSIGSDLIALGWQATDAERLKQNLRGSLNQISFVMQKLRSDMGDAHGTKPTLKPLVFDCIKFAIVLVRLLKI